MKIKLNHINFIALLFLLPIQIYAQQTQNKEPIVFGELNIGSAFQINGEWGYHIGGTLNYQHKRHLFSVRYLQNIDTETGLLYGQRWIYNGSSISLSAGMSLNHKTEKVIDGNNQKIINNYLGLPYELSFKWFKSKKKRYRIYELFPVGRPTSFGRSLGFKLLGNLSKNSFIGFGIVYGFGIHKKY